MTDYDFEDDQPIGLTGDEREAYNELQDAPIVDRVAEGLRTGTHVNGSIVPFPGTARGKDVLEALPFGERGVLDDFRAKGFSATTYDYVDEEGRLLMQVVQFRHPQEKKDVRPLRYLGTYENGAAKYWWTAIPGTRPLYGLDRLAARPDAPVLVVEGEKTANAAQSMFPDHAVICWPGGAKAVDRVDVSALAGRAIVGWPDNDPVGRSGMRRLLARAVEAGAQSAAMVLVPGEFPPKWDLADPLPDQVVDSAPLAELVAKPRPLSRSEARKLLDDPRK
ncbi:DUF6371 domain-containing protein [uncultured Sphingobium sp.]|uniref:DUF6371 domain-containing protein n=1 Tax=uncultured Sphingobium sp. TaxID=316087 RepID=UPI0026024A33|nr:DUF6371 domain-containing protein [uncultured Sphingobium sp.]